MIMQYINEQIRIPRSEFHFTYARSGGPGGQNVNKVNSKAVLRWDARHSPSLPPAVRDRFLSKFSSRLTKDGHLVLHSQKSRDQQTNADDCLQRLKSMLLQVAQAPVKRRKTRRSRGSIERRLQNKKAKSLTKRLRKRPAMD